MQPQPLKSCVDFLKTRPPLVLFLVILLTLALTTFTLAFYVSSEENLIDTDARQSWKMLSDQLSALELCAESKNYSADTSFQASVATLIHVDTSTIQEMTKMHAVFLLKNWHTNCIEDSESDVMFTVSFPVPSQERQQTTCALLTGPRQFLPVFTKPVCDYSEPVGGIQGSFSTNTCNSISSDKDPTLPSIKLQFDSEQNSENFAMFISEDDKLAIYIRLMWCSYILVFAILVILLCAVFHPNSQSYEESSPSYRYSSY